MPLGKVFVVGIGNALEFYHFLTYSYFAIQIGHCFFLAAQTAHGLLFSLATFGVGFFTRPLGAMVIGRIGDRVGRKPAMVLSFTLMGIGITGLALTPSYATIGVVAPILLLVFRLLQGFALGGQVGPSTAFLIEAAPPHRRGLYVAVQYMTQIRRWWPPDSLDMRAPTGSVQTLWIDGAGDWHFCLGPRWLRLACICVGLSQRP
jgi:MHS family citrate/tricarballylate:H+ symporter-like MFS transporter